MSVIVSNSVRNIPDNTFTNTTALPAAGASVTPTAFDLGDNSDGMFPEGVDLLLTVPATGSLVSAETITFTVLSDTASTPTTALSPSLTYTVTGTAGNGAAGTARWRLPANTARYLAVKATVSANAGNNVAVSYTSQLLF